ncbi:MAG TPA: GNAT family N-acetyltransferase [Trebonia sp.]|nr:GNAT family N-acetyltransferase [Trebonia sp.]
MNCPPARPLGQARGVGFAAAQGRGVGRELLDALIKLAGTSGVRRLRLCTLSPMKAAQHLYETAGFTRTPDLDWEPAPGVALRAYELAVPQSP